MKKNNTETSPRRKFLGTIAKGAAALSLTTFASSNLLKAGTLAEPETVSSDLSDAEEWFNKITGKHRIVYDVTQPHEGSELIMPFAWAKVF